MPSENKYAIPRVTPPRYTIFSLLCGCEQWQAEKEVVACGVQSGVGQGKFVFAV